MVQMRTIYHFGDSYSDPGNVPYDDKALRNGSFDIPLDGTDVTLQFRANDKSVNCDGELFPSFIAKSLGLEQLRASSLTALPNDKPAYINFAISGAGQRYNTSINPKTTNVGSFEHQIDRFINFTVNRQIKDDQFIYHDVGGNDLLQIIYAIAFNKFTDDELSRYIENEINEYVNATIQNLNALYDKGMRNLIIIVNNDAIQNIPMYIKFAKKLAYIDNPIGFIQTKILDKMVFTLTLALDEFGSNRPDLNFQRLFTKDYMDVIRTKNNIDTQNTLAGIGAWPMANPNPTKLIDKIMYIDDIHYTESINRLIAELLLPHFKKR
jgi:hypothetical protein